jgi:hypothetical protein
LINNNNNHKLINNNNHKLIKSNNDISKRMLLIKMLKWKMPKKEK